MDSGTQFSRVTTSIMQTVQLLEAEYSLKVEPGSPLARIAEVLGGSGLGRLGYEAMHGSNGSLAMLRAIFGLARILKLVQQAHVGAILTGQFKQKLKLLGVGVPSLCCSYGDLYPNGDMTERVRQASADIFELVVGLVCALTFDKKTRLSPKGRSAQPDVSFQADRVQWGLQCKVPISKKPSKWFDNFGEAAAQATVDVQQQRADTAVSVISVQNVFQHSILTVPSFEAAKEDLKRKARAFVASVQNDIQESRITFELIDVHEQVVPGGLIYFEDLYKIEPQHSQIFVPAYIADHQVATYLPIRYAQYITFGDRGYEATGVFHELEVALTGPVTEEMGSIYE